MKGWKEVLNSILLKNNSERARETLRFYYPSDVSLQGEEEVGCNDCQVEGSVMLIVFLNKV